MVDDDNDHHYNRLQQPNHRKTSYGRQSWKKHEQRDDKHHSKYGIEKHEEKYKQYQEYDEKKEEKDKKYREYDESNKRHRKYDNNKKKERDKHFRDQDDERKGNKDKGIREHDHKRESVKHCKETEEYITKNEKSEKETERHKYLNSDKLKDNEECIEIALTDSELNALAAKQIKAELMGNTVSTLYKSINF